jgi:hypothetical protein
MTNQRSDMESHANGNRFATAIKEGWVKALEAAHNDEALARAYLLGAPPMDERMIGTWIAYKYKFDEEGWWAGEVKKVSLPATTQQVGVKAAVLEVVLKVVLKLVDYPKCSCRLLL